MANRFLSNVNINDEYTLPSADGTADQIITTDGAGQLSFVDQSTIASGSAEVVEVPVKNLQGSALTKGDPVYISGSVGASGILEVQLADAGNAAKMPAVGLLKQDLAINAEGFAVVTGKLRNLVTSPIDGVTPNPNTVIYVKSGGTTGAALTTVKPTGPTNLIQNMGKVGRVSTVSDGTLVVSSILRSNDIPNLTTGKIWVGDGNTVESTVVHLDETNGRMGIGTTSPAMKLEVEGGDALLQLSTTSSTGNPYMTFSQAGTRRSFIQHRDSGDNLKIASEYGSISLFTGTGGTETERVTILSGGNVGIGTNGPSAKLDVVSGDIRLGTNATYFRVRDTASAQPRVLGMNSANTFYIGPIDSYAGGAMAYGISGNVTYHGFYGGGGEKVRITSAGQIGVGLTAPQTALQLYGTADDTTVGGAHRTAIRLTSTYASTFGGGGELQFGLAPSTAGRDALSVIKGSYSAYSSGNYGGDLEFHTRDADGLGLKQRMTVAHDGNVGIGTTSPSYTLDVEGPIRGKQYLYLKDTSGTNRLTIQAESTYVTHSIGALAQNFVANYYRFYDDTLSEMMRIADNGNVGIGTTSPTSKLHVAQDQNNTFSTAIAWTASANDVLNITNSNSTDTNNYASLYMRADGSSGNFSSRIVARNTTAGTGELHFQLRDSAHTANTETKLMIDSGGNVGIGTTSPSTTLEVVDTFSVQRTSLDNEGFYVTVSGSNENATIETFYQEDSVSNYGFRKRYDGSTNLYQEFIHNNSATGTEVYRVDRGTANTSIPNGNVGIGTTSPSGRLTIGSGAATDNSTMFNVNGQYNDVGFNGGTSGLLTQGVWSFINSATWDQTRFYVQDRNNADSRLTFDFRGNAGNTNILAGTSTGNVGVGTTSPSEKLHVYNGKAYVTPIAYAANQSAYALKVGAYNSTSFDMGLQAKSTSGGSPYMSFRTTSADNVLTIWGDKVGIKTTPNLSYNLDINGTLRTVGDSYFDDDIHLGRYIFHNGDTNTWFGFPLADTISFRTNGSDRMYITSSGNVGIGTTSPTSPLHIQKTLSGGQVMAHFDGTVGPSTYGALGVRVDNIDYGTGMRFYRSGIYDSGAIAFVNGTSTVGSININTSSTSYNTTSDYRLKENLTEITDGIDRLKQLKPKRFNFIGDTSVVDGFIAHEAKQVVPEAVTGEKDEVLPNGDPVYQGIDQAKIVPLLTAALQEAITKIEILEDRLQTLENK